VSEERQRVLRMLKAGKVTVEEAEALLEALGESENQEPAGRPAAGDVAAQAASGVPPADDQPAGRRGEFRRLVDDLWTSPLRCRRAPASRCRWPRAT
jgi:hypothetical protein